MIMHFLISQVISISYLHCLILSKFLPQIHNLRYAYTQTSKETQIYNHLQHLPPARLLSQNLVSQQFLYYPLNLNSNL
ncbi:MAG: hypothetical protein CBD13_000730 [Candidatus Pelagibacter sp. TMED153]|nr:MAG: hypothetical protein CBD13_000730 [Candidatus Pelagibacter sp. TMED153]